METLTVDNGIVNQEKAIHCIHCGNAKVFSDTASFDEVTGKRIRAYQCMTFGCLFNHICCTPRGDEHSYSIFNLNKCKNCGRVRG